MDNRKNGVKVISANENISEGSKGIILEYVLEGMAEYYSADLSEKVILPMIVLKCFDDILLSQILFYLPFHSPFLSIPIFKPCLNLELCLSKQSLHFSPRVNAIFYHQNLEQNHVPIVFGLLQNCVYMEYQSVC